MKFDMKAFNNIFYEIIYSIGTIENEYLKIIK